MPPEAARLFFPLAHNGGDTSEQLITADPVFPFGLCVSGKGIRISAPSHDPMEDVRAVVPAVETDIAHARVYPLHGREDHGIPSRGKVRSHASSHHRQRRRDPLPQKRQVHGKIRVVCVFLHVVRLPFPV